MEPSSARVALYVLLLKQPTKVKHNGRQEWYLQYTLILCNNWAGVNRKFLGYTIKLNSSYFWGSR